MDQIPISIAAKIAEYTVQPVGQWLCYSFHYDNNIKNMKNQVKVLEAARDRVRHRVNEAENNVEEIELDVKLWLTEVDDILGKVNEVLDNEDNANKSCSQMACPNVKLRHKHSKKAKNIMQEIDELLKKGKFDKVSYRPTSQGLVSTTNMDWVTFESRMSTMKELMESLQDANINKIGVWGMAGVGKTTLVREVASQVKKENLFDVVAIATVKQRLDDTGKLRIQGEIADELGLQLDKKETLSGRASLLRTRLTRDSGKLRIQGEIADELGLKLDKKETLSGRASPLRTRLTEDSCKLQIQGEMADELDLKLDKKETLSGRASLLQTRLTKDETTLTKDKTKKILVILDDIWENLDLSEIGIPCEGCKVVITSRERDIFSEMGVQKEFWLEVLPPKEAWRLFEKLVGDSLKDQLRKIAIEVSKECAGLPLALVTVANALKNKSEPQWKNALQQLRQPSSTNCNKMQKAIYSAIQLSYNHLENSEVQYFFLFCGHQKDPYIDYTCLLKYCFGLKLFHGTNTLEEARNRMDTLLHDLKDSGLLLDFTSDYVLMHDLVIDAAVFIASLAENVLLMRGDGPITWPSEEKMKTYTEIFVHDMGIKQFPDALECPKLKFLFVHGKDCPLEISETFCEGMRELKVLDLTKLRISLLPSSINLLTNLKTLCLDQCVLEDIALIGKLRNLEILSLVDSNVEQLPREIELLTHLRMLDLSNCTELKVIPPNVLSCLRQLEELYVSNSFTQWEVEGLNNQRASLAELKHLSRLTTLEVLIPDANMLPKGLLFKKLQRYKIFVGDVWDWFDCPEHLKALKLKLNTSFHLESGIKMLLSGIENLCLDELKGVKSVIYELDTAGFQQLKHLHVQNNVEIKYIINSRGMVISDVVFPVLEMLSLKNMINLEEICHGQIPSASFCNLSIMKVEHCEKLKFIFSSTIAKGLSQLQELVIQECSIMGAIIIKEEGEIEDTDMILFPQLRHLKLHQLPKLVSFFNTQKSVIDDAGEIIPECELDFHMPILQEQVVFPSLETLELSSVQSKEIQLHNQDWPTSFFKSTNIQTESRFQNLRNLTVKGSGNLKYLLSSSTATFMVQLTDLIIEDCKVMEEILLLTEDLGEEEIIPKVLFPRLEGLILKDLPVLKRFCVGRNIIFRSLKGLMIEKCPKLESFIFNPVSSKEISHTAMQPLFSEEIAFPSLEKLIILHMENLKIIWNKDLQGTFSFQNLQGILAMGCESLKSLLPTSVARCLQQLDSLTICECGIEEIIEQEDGAKDDAKFVFPKLTLLVLRQLPKLKWFYRGVHTSDWPLLKTLEVSGSNEIQIFASKNYRIEEPNEQSQLETSIQQPLFLLEEVAFPNLESLIISHLPNLKIIWHDKFAPGSFMKLQTMRVELCENLMKIFQVNMLSGFHSLNCLILDGCGSLQEIFEPQGQEVMETHAVTVTQLTKLVICRLPKLKRVWNKDPQGTFSFPNLQQIVVAKCESLKSLFPTSVARCLQQLNDLRIVECGIEEIIEQEEGAKEDARFLFPKLTLLILRKLSKLKWFYRGVHTSEWPLLESLEVSESNEIQIFASKNYRIQEQDEQSQLETSIQQPLFLVEEVAFPSLKELFLHQCVLEDIAMIGELRNLEKLSLLDSNVQQLPRETRLLTHLQILNLRNCTKLKVIPPNVLSCLIQLEELYVGNSFTQWDVEGLNNERASLAELKHLSRLTSLQVHIPDANMLPKDLLFEKLQRYKIFVGDVWDWSDCPKHSRALKLKLNSSFHLERGIKMLLNGIENLCLDELKGVKSVIDELDMTGFQQLKHLHVQNNAEIKYIINSRGMVISNVVFPVLEMLSLKNMINLEEICHGQIPSASFRNLSTMKVEHCQKLKFIFSSTIAKGLPQLQELVIQECSIMGAIIIKEEGEIEDRDMILFPQLRHLELHQLPKLVSFLIRQKSVINDPREIIPKCELDFHMPIPEEQVMFPNLETLELSSILSEEILIHNQHQASSSFKLTDPRFQNLCKLKLKGSGNLKYLLSSSTVTFMVQLKYLDIEDCKVMEEVLLTEDLGEEEIIPKVLFSRLENLILKDLPVLKRFCIGTNLRFPSLKSLRIEQCPKLESFIFKPVSLGMTLSKEIKEVNSEEISQTAMQHLFNEEVAFSSLETLTIMHMENLKIIWHDQLAGDSFFKLQFLLVEHCENLVNIFESNMLTRFQSLETLEVSCCGSLKEVFELQRYDIRETHAMTAIPLKRLILYSLPKMKQVWNKDPQGIFSFQNLQEIEVDECESLQSLFPASVARCLMQLEDLQIFDSGVEEIVAREDGAEAVERFVFPKVTQLILNRLPKLKWFCRGEHTSEWPLLKELWVRGCDQIEIFTSKILNFQEMVKQSQLETSIQQPLFLVEEGTLFPNLEVLLVGVNCKMKEIQHDQLFEECLYKLKVLHVIDYVAVSDWITFLKRLHSLEKIFVDFISWEEIFPYKELFDMENHATILAQLRELELSELHMLTHLWKEDTQSSPILYNLKSLKVSLCGKLKILVPSSVFFQNLTYLEILKCHGLINLVTSSTAKSLVQLKKMSVSQCKRITEVVVGEGGEANEVITFTQLTYLKLDYLTNLTSFCSGSYSFVFPSLEEVIVRQCPEMKSFSRGAIRTPMLERVQATEEDEWHWKANLNTTIHWLWENNL